MCLFTASDPWAEWFVQRGAGLWRRSSVCRAGLNFRRTAAPPPRGSGALVHISQSSKSGRKEDGMRVNSCAAMLVLTLLPAAPGGAAAQTRSAEADRFRAMDQDRDGVITQAEWRGGRAPIRAPALKLA